MAVWQASRRRLKNFSVLVSHVLVPPAITAILSSRQPRAGIFGAGPRLHRHGLRRIRPIAARYKVPIVITGFEPVDLLEGVVMGCGSSKQGRAEVENQYARAVRPEGNLESKKLIDEIFEITDRKWRGVGIIPKSGYRLVTNIAITMRSLFEVEVYRNARIERLHQRPNPAGPDEAAPMPSVRHHLHAAVAAGRNDGFQRSAFAAYYAYGRHLESSASTPASTPHVVQIGVN